jgi:hypothetical protein
MSVVRMTQELAEQATPGDLLWDDKVRGLLARVNRRV